MITITTPVEIRIQAQFMGTVETNSDMRQALHPSVEIAESSYKIHVQIFLNIAIQQTCSYSGKIQKASIWLVVIKLAIALEFLFSTTNQLYKPEFSHSSRRKDKTEMLWKTVLNSSALVRYGADLIPMLTNWRLRWTMRIMTLNDCTWTPLSS